MDDHRDPIEEPEERGPDNGDGAGKEFWRSLLPAIRNSRIFHPEEWPLRKMVRRAVLLTVAVLILGVLSQSVAYVRENQVGVIVQNITGKMDLRDRPGFHLVIPYLSRFYVLDKTIHRVDLTWAGQGAGGTSGQDVKLKTADGSDVSLDVSISYKLIPDRAVEVLRRSGRDMALVPSRVESFARHVCFSEFGQLTTEEMYDSVQRNEKAQGALQEINRTLETHGIEVIAMIPGEFRFYEEYEQVIKEKKLADQQVEEQRSQARKLLEEQARQLVEAEKEGEKKIVAAKGNNTNQLIQAGAEAKRTQREADGYSAARLLEADAALYQASREAEGRRATLLSEAAGLREQRQAMSGVGGLTMVGLEYARRLENVRFSGTPITREPSVQQFSVQAGEGAPLTSPASTMMTPGLMSRAAQSQFGPVQGERQ
jgi:regulator of protease activity HflC (stomatin/prohibitin superfamily)